MTRTPADSEPAVDADVDDGSATAEAVSSPCINTCALDSDGVCLGCGRTMAEIRDWTALSEQQRRAIRNRLSESGSESDCHDGAGL